LFKIEFATDSSAFHYVEDEIAQVLLNVTQRVRDGSDGGGVVDSFGNTIGEWSLTKGMNDVPVVQIPAAVNWQAGYEHGLKMDGLFPGQDASVFCSAVEFNDIGPLSGRSITGLVMNQEGYNDGDEWIWKVTLDNGTVWIAEGGCDFTGWDCQSWLSWCQA
jgi:hypothetical protein